MNEYDSLSKIFVQAWQEGVEAAERAEIAVSEMLGVLKAGGFARTAAINKIAADHKQLKGFSVRTIYRSLPAEEKRQYLTQPKPETSKKSNVPNGRIYASDTEDDSKPVKEPTTLGELEHSFTSAAKQIAETVHPPKQPETPHDDKPTDESDDGTEEYHGDAGNNPALIKKYVKESDPLVIFIDVPKFFGQLFAANRNNVGAYIYVKDAMVYKVEAANVHKVEVKA